MSKGKNLARVVNEFKPSNRRNSMGCSEDWYDFIYSMKETFFIDEIENMSDHEIELLERLHDKVSSGLY